MNVSIKDCPDEVYQLIKQKARESGNTINRTLVDLITSEMIPQAIGTDEFLAEVRKTRQKLKMEISHSWLNKTPSGLKESNQEEAQS